MQLYNRVPKAEKGYISSIFISRKPHGMRDLTVFRGIIECRRVDILRRDNTRGDRKWGGGAGDNMSNPFVFNRYHDYPLFVYIQYL